NRHSTVPSHPGPGRGLRASHGLGGPSRARSAVEKICVADVLNLYQYEKIREVIRREVIEAKRRRRVSVGDRLSFVFENRQTVLFQIQEMVRAERIVADDRVQDEIDVYNGLIPEPGELSATMMIEIEDKAQIQPVLDSLLGIDSGDHV